ncbi:MAG: hypothetical protein QM831_30555 [Kofleriaceae bacterium]
MGRAIAVATILLSAGLAGANPIDLALVDGQQLKLDDEWPALPDYQELSMEDRITDKVSDAGNDASSHVDAWTRHYVSWRVDGRRNRGSLHLGNEMIALDSNWLFANSRAHIDAKLELNVASHHIELELPGMDLSRDSVRNDSVSTLNVAVLEKRF